MRARRYRSRVSPEQCSLAVDQVYRKLCPRGLAHNDREDVKQAGWLGALGAIPRFQPKRKTSFLTFAWSAIRGQMIFELQRLNKDPHHAARWLSKYRAFYGLHSGDLPAEPPSMEALHTAGLAAAEARSCYRYLQWRCAKPLQDTAPPRSARRFVIPPVEDMVGQLRAKDAQAAYAITLRFLQEKSWKTVARSMGLPLGSVPAIVARGIAVLRAQFLEGR